MSRGVHISTILHLYRLRRRLHQPPKLELDIVLGNHHVPKAVRIRVARTRTRRRIGAIQRARLRGVTQEPEAPELAVASLETRQAVLLALVEPEVAARSEEAVVAEPLAARDVREGRVEAEHVESWWPEGVGRRFNTHQRSRRRTTVTTIAYEHSLTMILLEADLAVQLYNIDMSHRERASLLPSYLRWMSLLSRSIRILPRSIVYH